jgi:hypothetical protein
MDRESAELKKRLGQISQKWMSEGLPSRQTLKSTAESLNQWKRDHLVSGIWQNHPLMMAATIDDGIGQGIQIIECYAEVMGITVNPIGLLQNPETIIDKCHQLQPDILGLTVLQLDSEDALYRVGHNLPLKTCLIAGGPVFKFDANMAARCNVDYVASNLAYFIRYMLKWTAK